MLILLPPSEGKTPPPPGADPLQLDALVAPELTRTRRQLVNATVKLCSGRWQRAAEVLGLGPTQGELIALNAELSTAPTAPAIEVYTGVLYDHLDAASLPPEDVGGNLFIASALFGVVRSSDPIPAYRLSAGTSLPRLGTLTSRWRPVLPKALQRLADGGLVVDLRSGAYVSLGQLPSTVPTVSMRVLHERGGRRTVVSHFNKATKGRIVRDLVRHRVDAAHEAELAAALTDLGWSIERNGRTLDVIVDAV